MPSAVDVFNYYLTNGTVIDESSLPPSFDDRFIEDVVIGPTLNPYGVENAEGIYVIDCGGRIYLAKDTLTRPEHFRAMETRLDAWNEIRHRWDPSGRIMTALSARLLGDRT